jgi:hypothetical protein
LYSTHGIVGCNLFLAAYGLAMLNPSLRLFSAAPPSVKWIALVVMLVTAVVTVVSILVHGGGGAGEPLGCLAGVLVWLGRFAGPALASRLAPASSQPDLWQIVGGSIPPVAIALALWFMSRTKRLE